VVASLFGGAGCVGRVIAAAVYAGRRCVALDLLGFRGDGVRSHPACAQWGAVNENLPKDEVRKEQTMIESIVEVYCGKAGG
jgi:hypothetical protein